MILSRAIQTPGLHPRTASTPALQLALTLVDIELAAETDSEPTHSATTIGARGGGIHWDALSSPSPAPLSGGGDP